MSLFVIEKMKKGLTALVHCSDGWDRTAQVCSLIQLIIDPYFRSYEGFFVLIEKDWVSYGHQFSLRQGVGNKDEKGRSPVFLQFLDCVHQLYCQNPQAFQFNLDFLKDLAYHSYSGAFGTFLSNNDTEREVHHMHSTTISIWSYF